MIIIINFNNQISILIILIKRMCKKYFFEQIELLDSITIKSLGYFEDY